MRFESHDGTEYTLVGTCATVGCHDETSEYGGKADFDAWAPRDVDGDGTVEGIQTEMDDLADSLAVLVDQSNQSEHRFVPDQRQGDARSAGAAYNWKIYEEDRSHGIHNPKYFESLLKSSIEHMVANPIP